MGSKLNDEYSETFMFKFMKHGWWVDLKLGLSKQEIIAILSMPDGTDVLKAGYELWLYQDLQLTFKDEQLLAYKFEPDPRHSYLECFASEEFKQQFLDPENAVSFLDANKINWIPYPDFTFEDQYTILTVGNVLLFYTREVLERISVHGHYQIE